MILSILLLAGFVAGAAGDGVPDSCFFQKGAGNKEYILESPLLSGKIDASGSVCGITPLVYRETGMALASPYGLFSYYRIFSTNHRYVESMRALPAETELHGRDCLEVRWQAAEGRPYVLRGIYRWVEAGILDFETIVEAVEDLPDFEVFLSSYMTEGFPSAQIFVKKPGGEPSFLKANPAAGAWQAFPGDSRGLSLIRDGRWTIPPSPVDWTIPADYAHPLIFRRHEATGLTVALMARAQDCFAVMAPQDGDAHFSMYFSLFGRTIKAGEKASTTTRLLIGKMDDAELLRQYGRFCSKP
jgi:hypothetical protein